MNLNHYFDCLCCIDREEVIVFKTVAKTVQLAKAIYLGPNDTADKNLTEVWIQRIHDLFFFLF